MNVIRVCVSGEERAGLAIVGGRDGPLASAALHAHLPLSVPQPAAVSAGIGGERRADGRARILAHALHAARADAELR